MRLQPLRDTLRSSHTDSLGTQLVLPKLFDDGAYAHQRLNLETKGKAHGRNAKASNRTTGNPAVRHYRLTYSMAEQKGERRSATSQAPPLLRQRKPYLTGSPPSRQKRRYRQDVEF
jgi:hypothetical protein